ncbi:hypothetical protein BSKO_06094 [Bryopsis sp. KO-2023]|nr:hypothetical protein BSKO_06094 [Bryopsis sp. KO-2023]
MPASARKKVIIDTDPGIDDAMAILIAMESPEVEIIGLTTVHGNLPTREATKNALRLMELSGHDDVPVAEGSNKLFNGEDVVHVASFVHGDDGLGNTNQPEPKGAAIEESAVDFLVNTILRHPGEVYVLALGPLTNVALALQKVPGIANKWAGLVCMGGAFFMNGNVNPASEANIRSDPEAADFVFRKGSNITAIGLDVTCECIFHKKEILGLKGKGKYGDFLRSIIQFYWEFYRENYFVDGVVPHDAVALVALIFEDLFEFREGGVRVATEGICRGQTLMDSGWKHWRMKTEWSDCPKVKVASGVNHQGVMDIFHARITG